MQKRIILLGGSGFIGQSFLRYLEEQGKREKYLIAVCDPRRAEFFEPDIYLPAPIQDTDQLKDFIKDDDIIIHLVHTTLPSDTMENPQREYEENYQPSLKLMELIREKTGIVLVYFSSGGTIYGEPEKKKPIKEDAPLKPGSAYALCKQMIEETIELYSRVYQLDYLILRPGNPYGPYQERLNRHGAVAQIFRCLKNEEPFLIYGDGETVRDYIFIDDLISALIFLLERGVKNQKFNLGTGVGTSLNRLISLCEKISGKKLEKIFKPLRPADLKYNVLNIDRLKSLGWKPDFNLEQGLKLTWEYFKEL